MPRKVHVVTRTRNSGQARSSSLGLVTGAVFGRRVGLLVFRRANSVAAGRNWGRRGRAQFRSRWNAGHAGTGQNGGSTTTNAETYSAGDRHRDGLQHSGRTQSG